MPTVELDPTLTMYYEDDCFADPWRKSEVAVLVHGCAESSRAWYAWVPTLARDLRVIRIDQRGFGRSTLPPQDYAFSLSARADDLARFLDALDLESVHVVGAKVGGAVSLLFAAMYPERARTLSVVHGLMLGVDPNRPASVEAHHTTRIPSLGVRRWAEQTQRLRLGSDAPDEMISWWTDFMGAADQRCSAETAASAVRADVLGMLPRIKAPTLVLHPDRSDKEPVETVRQRQQIIQSSELKTVSADAYHIAAARPDECARHVLSFIKSHSSE